MAADAGYMYEKIEGYLADLISRGKLKEGDRIPTDRALAGKFETSNMPVRRAMQKFIDDGTLVRIQGKGTFIRRSPQVTRHYRIGVLYYTEQDVMLTNSFYSALLGGVEAQSSCERIMPLIRSMCRFDGDDPLAAFTELEGEVDGFIIIDLSPRIAERIRKTTERIARYKPVVVLNYEADWENVDFVVTDSRQNTEKVIRFLIGQGHTRIGCMYGFSETEGKGMHPNAEARLDTYNKIMAQEGLERVSVNFADKEGTEKLLTGKDAPTALFCTGTHMIVDGIYPLARRLGLSIPGDLSVVGYDDIRECELLQPAITAVDTSLVELGRQGVRRLLERQHSQTCLSVQLPGGIKERGSHARYRPQP